MAETIDERRMLGQRTGRQWAEQQATAQQLKNLVRNDNYPVLNWQELIRADDNWVFIASLISGMTVTAVPGLFRPDLSMNEANSFWESTLAADVEERNEILRSEAFLTGFCEAAAAWYTEHSR